MNEDLRLQYPLSDVEKLSKTHDLDSFDCGKASLNEWLKRYARHNQSVDAAQTYVVHRRQRVTGYYSLAYGSVQREETFTRIAKGLARHPVPVIILARLAVDLCETGTGLGKALLKSALIQVDSAADIAGARALLVHAIDEEARKFYEHFGFEISPVNEYTLMLLMKDLRAMKER
jgi:GNAT superfamily N-acetyltransferase